MRVRIPSPLFSYTGADEVVAEARSLDELFVDLDRRHPGLRFRVVDEQGQLRTHMRVFVNGAPTRDLSRALGAHDEVHIVQALSGG